MDKSTVTLADIARELGFDPKNARILPLQVKVEPYDDGGETALATLASAGIEEAAAPITDSGKPRMLKLTAWMAHGGPANRNKDAFLDEDLQEVAENGLFAPPYLGMVDFNHDFFPYGAWYSARYEFDPKANQYGLLAEGTLFAWRFTEMADKLLAEQSRNGFVPVSMACIAQWIEPREGADGSTESVLRKPVFLAVSVLDVPPADPNARSVGTEDEASTPAERLQELNKALLSPEAFDVKDWMRAAQTRIGKVTKKTPQEEQMDLDQIIAKLTEALDGKASEVVEAVKAAVADTTALNARVAELEATNAELEASKKVAEDALVQAQTDLEGARTALEAKTAELTELTVAHEAIQTELNTLKAEAETKRIETIREERLQQLPEIYIKVLDNREETAREKAITRLVEMSDEEFEQELELLTAGSSTSYSSRSAREGIIPSGKGSGGSLAIDKFFNKK